MTETIPPTPEQAAAFRAASEITKSDSAKALDQITAELHAVNEGLDRMNKSIQAATMALYTGQILAAKIAVAKKDCDFNDAVKRASGAKDAILESFREINNGNQKRQTNPQNG